jgi:hypothetical protein
MSFSRSLLSARVFLLVARPIEGPVDDVRHARYRLCPFRSSVPHCLRAKSTRTKSSTPITSAIRSPLLFKGPQSEEGLQIFVVLRTILVRSILS